MKEAEAQEPSKGVKNPHEDGKQLKKYTLTEVYQHRTREDCWVAIEGKVYEITEWISRHPGGDIVITGCAGQDVTEEFVNFHPQNVRHYLPQYLIGEVIEEEGMYNKEIAEDFVKLRNQIREDGLYKLEKAWYYKKLIITFIQFGFALYTLLASESRLGLLFGAFQLGMFWQQIAFLGHDWGHNSLTGTQEGDTKIARIVTLLFGVSGQWWKRSHNHHHVVCNSIENDADIQYLPVFSVTAKMLKGFYSNYYKKYFPMDAAARFLVQYQKYTLLPIMAVARFNLYRLAIENALNFNIRVIDRFWDSLSMIGFWVWYIALLMQMPTGLDVFLVLLISHGVAGIIHLQIVISHFAMPHYHQRKYDPKNCANWLMLQLETTLDVDCPKYMDWFHGGLQYQVEHHLFTNVPRCNYRTIKEKYLIPFCDKHEIKYYRLSFLNCLAFVLHRMGLISEKLKKGGDVTEESTQMLFELLSAYG